MATLYLTDEEVAAGVLGAELGPLWAKERGLVFANRS